MQYEVCFLFIYYYTDFYFYWIYIFVMDPKWRYFRIDDLYFWHWEAPNSFERSTHRMYPNLAKRFRIRTVTKSLAYFCWSRIWGDQDF